VDETAKGLTGIEWRIQAEKQGGEHWTGGIWLGEVTKGFEINDLGYSTRGERLDGGARLGYREIRPGSLFRNYSVSFMNYHNWSHEALDEGWSLDSWHRARIAGSYTLHANGELLNYWNIRSSASYSPQAMSRSATRGGPMMVDPASARFTLNVSSDRRKPLSMGANVEIGDDRIGAGRSRELRADVRVRPSDNLEISVHPRWETSRSGSQYVTATSTLSYDPTYGTRYLFADLERRSFSMVTRMDWTFSPTLSLQLYAQLRPTTSWPSTPVPVRWSTEACSAAGSASSTAVSTWTSTGTAGRTTPSGTGTSTSARSSGTPSSDGNTDRGRPSSSCGSGGSWTVHP
jgi:hypothetical protein